MAELKDNNVAKKEYSMLYLINEKLFINQQTILHYTFPTHGANTPA